jgi:predicted HTH transcriptional regulator
VVKFYGPGEKILDLVPSIPEHRQTDLKKLGLNERQIEALRIMVNEKKVFSNQTYRAHFNVSNQTFVRDMKLMVEIGQVRAAGKGRSLRFSAE